MKFKSNILRIVSNELHVLIEPCPRPNRSVTRSGWPQLSRFPLLRRRRTDALRWNPGGPRDDWKR